MIMFPSIQSVDTIATHPNPVLRNLQITQCYYELSQAMTRRTGACANWCTFATWASKQAGQTIRKEDLQVQLEQLLLSTDNRGGREAQEPRGQLRQILKYSADEAVGRVADVSRRPVQEVQQLLWKALNPKVILERASEAVARGNQKVFAEIGREFARFGESCAQDLSYNESNIAAFCAALREGEPPQGQAYLKRAFSRYYEAFFETDEKKRAELILLANIEIGFHEQTRLQPEIAAAMYGSIGNLLTLTVRLINGLFPRRGWLMFVGFVVLRWLSRPHKLEDEINKIISSAYTEVQWFLTKHLMMLGLPNGTYLKLSEDLTAAFPESLQHLKNPDLQAMLQRVDPTPDSVQQTGALDWANLPERLHYIVDLFRCYQENEALLQPPFTEVQVLAIRAGRMPLYTIGES